MNARERLARIRSELKSLFIERDVLVDGVLVALLSRQHVLMLGPPGTAKSMLAREVCRRVGGGAYFEWLLTKFTTPEEIFGPVSLPALEAGRFERITTGKLPESEIVFLDEIFKANSAILNALLTILNERRYHQGSRAVEVPLKTLMAASNELPEEDELAALYDRFVLRFTVAYIEHDHHFVRLLRLEDSEETPSVVLSAGDLADLLSAADRTPVPDGVLRDIIEIRRKLNAEGVVASDRRYRAALSVLRASALLDGRDAVSHHDLRWLEHLLWSDPEERPKVLEIVSSVASGFEEEARRLLVQAQEIESYARRPWPDRGSKNRALLEAHTKLEDIHRRIEGMVRASRERGRDSSAVFEVDARVVDIQRGLLAEQDAWQS